MTTKYGINYKLDGEVIASEEFDTLAERDARLEEVVNDTSIYPTADTVAPFVKTVPVLTPTRSRRIYRGKRSAALGWVWQ